MDGVLKGRQPILLRLEVQQGRQHRTATCMLRDMRLQNTPGILGPDATISRH